MTSISMTCNDVAAVADKKRLKHQLEQMRRSKLKLKNKNPDVKKSRKEMAQSMQKLIQEQANRHAAERASVIALAQRSSNGI